MIHTSHDPLDRGLGREKAKSSAEAHEQEQSVKLFKNPKSPNICLLLVCSFFVKSTCWVQSVSKKYIFRFKKTCWVQENQTRNGCLKSMGEGAHQLPSLDWQKPRDWRHYDIAAGIRIEQADIYLQRAIQEKKRKRQLAPVPISIDVTNSSSDLQ